MAARSALRGLRSARQLVVVTRFAEVLPNRAGGDILTSLNRFPHVNGGARFFSMRKDPDSLLIENIKKGVQQGLKEVLAKNDGKSVLKLSVVKSGVNAGVKESLKEYNVYIDFAESDLNPVTKAAIEDAVVRGLDNFVHQLHKAPPLEGQVKGPYLLKLALREAIKEGMDEIYLKFSVYIGRGMDVLIRDLALIKDQTKGTDFVQVFFSRLAHQWLNDRFISFLDNSWTVIPYVAGAYLSVLFIKTLVESGIPPWEYHEVLNFYRVYRFSDALEFYKKEKKKKKAEAAKKKEAEAAQNKGGPEPVDQK